MTKSAPQQQGSCRKEGCNLEEKKDLYLPYFSLWTSLFIINRWEGALVAMKVTRSTAPLELFAKVIFDTVRP